MALKTTCLIFGTIIITLQCCQVFCYQDPVITDVTMKDVYGQNLDKIYFTCKYLSYYDPNKIYTCKFQLSDGTFIKYKAKSNDEPENVNGTYNYTINHKNYDNQYTQCMIKIHAPFDKLLSRDTWKCWITTQSRTISNIYKHSLKENQENSFENCKTTETITQASTDESLETCSAPTVLEPIISSDKVTTIRGATFMIGCQVMEPIDYCFLTSPSGKMYAVRYSKSNGINSMVNFNNNQFDIAGAVDAILDGNTCQNSPEEPIKPLKPSYDSKFSIGDCFVALKNATNTDNGNWTCHLGLNTTKKEIQTNVSVTVEESYLLSSVEKNSETSKTIIKCFTIPTFSSKIINCRWTFPNGTGIYKNDFSNIKVSQNDTSCVLDINDWKDDYQGKWSCFVEYANDFDNKFYLSKFISV